MKILFITMVWPKQGCSNMYTDLVNEFVDNGHNVYVATLCEKRMGIRTGLQRENNVDVLRVRCGNIQKVNKYKKVISSFVGGYLLYHNVKKFFKGTKFDLIVFALPPLTIVKNVVRIKKKFGCKLYLLLKD